MRSIMAKLPAAEQISIVPLADLHVGDSSCDWQLIKTRIDNIKSDPHAYAILDGDLIDNATRNSIGDVYSQTANPNEQINLLVRLLQPIAKTKVLAACPGNHEQRSWRSDGLDVTMRICHELGIVDKYSPATAVLNITIGKIQYSIYVTHGSGGGRKLGAKANRLLELSDIIEADVYLQGHTHCPMVTRKTRMEVKNGKLQQREMLFVNTAACLKSCDGGYAEVQGFTPTSTVNPTIYLSGKTKFAWAVL